MKRIISMIILATLVLTMLASCGEPFKCVLCGEEKTGKQYTVEVLGQELSYCKDCKKKMDDAGKGIEDFVDDLGKNIGDGISDLGDKIADLFS